MNTADLTDTIVPKSDQLNADDLLAVPLTVQIESVCVDYGAVKVTSVRYDCTKI